MEQEFKRRKSDFEIINEKPNGNILYLRREWIVLAVSMLLIFSGMLGSWYSLKSEVSRLEVRVSGLEVKLAEHVAKAETFVSVDLWKERNKFVDEKLDRILARQDTVIEALAVIKAKTSTSTK